MSPTSNINKVRRALAIDGVLLGVTLVCAVAFNPWVVAMFEAPPVPAPPAPAVAAKPDVHSVPNAYLNPPVSAAGMAAVSVAKPAAVATPGVGMTATLDRTSVMVGKDGEVRAELVITAPTETEAIERRDTDLVVILDRSGSMQGDKLHNSKDAIGELISQLGPRDRFALVTYSDDAGVLVPLAHASASNKSSWRSTVDRVRADGYTNMSAGMERAFDLIESNRTAGRAARAVLLSDGLPNLGDPSSEGLFRRASRAPRGEYVMSAIGVGEDFNEFLMTRLADAGTGNYHFLANGADLGKVFANELNTARATVASNVAVTIKPAANISVVDASGYPLELQRSGDVVFRPGILFSGQERRIWVTFKVRADNEGTIALGDVSMSYKRNGEAKTIALATRPSVTAVVDKTVYYSSIDKDNWERSVVTEEYNELKTRVSRAVSNGRKDEAMGYLRDYRTKNAEANFHVQSAAVDDNLSELDGLEAEVEEAFEGEDQRAKQNIFSKTKSEDAYKSRRVGQVLQ